MSGSLIAAGISKRFGSVQALDRVSAEFRSGEVHAVLGENGAGKSTLASVLAGFVSPDAGTERFASGEELPFGHPGASRRAGIEMIHQHFMLVPEFTVAENLALSALRRLDRGLDIRALAQAALNIGERLGWSFDPASKVRELPVGVRQRLEIVKALAGNAKVLLFDEPTAVLAGAEVDELLRVLGELRDEGRILVLIAHKLSEVMAIADRVTVLRKGSKVAEAARGEFDANTLAQWMVGELPPTTRRTATSGLAPGLVVKDLVVRGDRGELAVRGVSFEIGKGEVLGLGGVDGNGQLELAEAIARVRPTEAGSVTWADDTFRVGYIPQDRRRDGLALSMPVRENMLITGFRKPELRCGPFLRSSKIIAWSRELINRFNIDASSPEIPISSLSGGNQQKVVVARTLDLLPDLLVVSGPTRGLDVRSTAYVREQILEARGRGAAVLLVSADLDELAEVADRTAFMSRGTFASGEGAAAVVGGEV